MFGLDRPRRDNCSSRPLSPPRFSSGHHWSYSETLIVFVQLTVLPFVTLPLSLTLLFPCVAVSARAQFPLQHNPPETSRTTFHAGQIKGASPSAAAGQKTHLYFLSTFHVFTAILQYLRERIQRCRNPRILSEHEWTSAFIIQERKKRHFKLSKLSEPHRRRASLLKSGLLDLKSKEASRAEGI